MWMKFVSDGSINKAGFAANFFKGMNQQLFPFLVAERDIAPLA